MYTDHPASPLTANGHLSRLSLPDLTDECLTGAECLFDPDLHDGPDPVTTTEHPDARAAREDVARQICADCPALEACEEYWQRTLPARGVWAGLTADERASVISRGLVDGREVA